MSGFQNAGVTKGIMVLLGITSLAVSLTDSKPYVHLQLVPHISKYHQFWRLAVHPLAFANSTELLIGELLLYKVGVGIERSFGSRKYASFALVSTVLSSIISFLCILLLHRFGLNSIPAGPYGLIFSILWQYYRIIPSLYAFKIFGLELSYKTFNWILAVQLILSKPPGSAVAAGAGFLTGYLYRTDTPFLLPSLARPRRLWRPLKEYRIPLSLHHLLARAFAPISGTSPAPRRAHRVLPGQVRDAPTDHVQSMLDGTAGLRGLLSRNPTTPTRRAAANANANPLVTPPRGIEGDGDETPDSPQAAVGEWVNDLTGRGGARAPTEQEITALSNMFPNISRDSIVRALQRSNYNTAQAVELLLEQP